jgi:hypothetical protein
MMAIDRRNHDIFKTHRSVALGVGTISLRKTREKPSVAVATERMALS